MQGSGPKLTSTNCSVSRLVLKSRNRICLSVDLESKLVKIEIDCCETRAGRAKRRQEEISADIFARLSGLCVITYYCLFTMCKKFEVN